MNKLKLSVVTVAKDNESGLRATLDSIDSQTENPYEIILVIAKSMDQTLELAESYTHRKSCVSVVIQDGYGIYNALNIGIKNSSADLIWFMNSGDVFASENALKIGLEKMKNYQTQIIIGGFGKIDIDSNLNFFEHKLGYVTPLRFAFNRTSGCHQSMVFDRRIFLDFGFYEEKYKFAADFEIVLKAALEKKVFGIPEVLSIVESNGITDQNLTKMYWEKHKIRIRLLKNPFLTFFSLIWTLLGIVKYFLKKRVQSKFTSIFIKKLMIY